MAKQRRLKKLGQKVNPNGLRIGINRDWESRWFASNKEFAQFIKEDISIRKLINDQIANSGISKIEIERTSDEVKIDVFTSKPGVVIGKRGTNINDIKEMLQKNVGKNVQLNIIEVKKPELVSKLVAEGIASQLEGRVSFRKAMKKAVSLTMKAGARGIRVQCSGRLGGAEMARTEWYREGRVPLHTLRAAIDYGFAEANTTFGKIGVKVWIYLGDVIIDKVVLEDRAAEKAKKEEAVS